MEYNILTFLTDFGDQATVLPLTMFVMLVLVVQQRWRVAFAWLSAIFGVLAVILILKIIFYACGWLLPVLGPDMLSLRSPSGHTASATVLYGGIVALLSVRFNSNRIWAAYGSAVVTAVFVAVVIGGTRILLGAHSFSEVSLAACIGLMGLIAFIRLSGQDTVQPLSFPVVSGAVMVLAVFHGRHLPAEVVIQSTGVDILRSWLTLCRPENPNGF